MKTLRMLGVPLDLGAGRRGVDMGPSALRIARLNRRIAELGYTVEEGGDMSAAIPEMQDAGDLRARYLAQIVEVCERLGDHVRQTLDAGWFPLVLGGDHSVAIGTIAGASRYYRQRGERMGLIWVDAHTDMNTPQTTPSGNIHGMPLAVSLGHGVDGLTQLGGYAPKVQPEDTVLIGVRSIDDAEKEQVRKTGVTVFTMRDIDEQGMSAVVHEALHIAMRKTAGFHVSFDVDALDPGLAPGVGTPISGGLTYREAHLLMEYIADSGRLTSLEVVEINPIVDTGNTTAEVAAGLVLSALGKTIL
ncbi:MAG: arginase [candidate division Zixibacteria bacterium]|nr:arginase [candidate division Zixibacteria bacterium]